MRRVTIDPVARVARAEAGAEWADVVAPAAQHGGDGALAAVEGNYALFAIGPAPPAAAASASASAIRAVKSAMSRWASGQMYLNIGDMRQHPHRFWTPVTYDPLRRIKSAVDPENVIRSNLPIPPAGPWPALASGRDDLPTSVGGLAAGHRADDQVRFGTGRDGLGQRGV